MTFATDLSDGGRPPEQHPVPEDRRRCTTQPPALHLAKRVAATARHHALLLTVLTVFSLAAIVVPTLTEVATTDDWAYARSSQILVEEGRLVVFSVVAATAVFQIAWGALFGLLFGPELGVFRLSTVVMVAIGGLGLFGLCRTLGVDRGRGALGVASYLFNPLMFVLAFTFMTDAHFATLLVLATAGYAHGLGSERPIGWALVAGSGAAACAFLTRQQGALIAPAVIGFLLVMGRLRFDRASMAMVGRVAGLPFLAIAGYGLWLRYWNDVPVVQSSFVRDALADGWSGTWWLLQRLTVIELVYFGFFLLPITAAVLPAIPKLWRGLPRRSWLAGALWAGLLVVGVVWFWRFGYRMPYASQFFGRGGLGAPDLLGSRPIVIERQWLDWLTIVCGASALVLSVVVARGVAAPRTPERTRAGLVLVILLGQVVGVMPPSYHYIGRTAGTLDRYLLPLLPLAIALALWATKGVGIRPALGWIVVVGFAAFSVAGTRDYLVFMREVWRMGHEANAAGAANVNLDAGSGWDGYYLYEQSVAAGLTRARSPNGSPWWVYFYAKATDSTYVVASKPLPERVVVWERPYSAWLSREPTRLYLLRQPNALWPPLPPPPLLTVEAAPGLLRRAPILGLVSDGESVIADGGNR